MEGLTPQGGAHRPFPLPILANLATPCEKHAAAGSTLHPQYLDGWADLATRCKASPFLDPGWLKCWWPAFGVGEIEISTIWRQGRLAAVLPMARRAGQLESTANYHTPVFGILAEDDMAASSLARDLFARAPARITFAALEPEGQTLRVCQQAAAEAGFRVITRPHLASPYVDLNQGWDAYHGSLRSHLLRNLRRGKKQLEKIAPLRVEIVDGTRPFDEERLEKAFHVEASGWKGKNGSAIQSHPHTLEFYRRVAKWAADESTLRLYLLRCGDLVLTMCFTLQQHGSCYMLKGGYDEEFKRFSPGQLLTEAILEDCAQQGVKRVEIFGEAETYKMHWATGTHEALRFEAFAPTLAGRMAWMQFKYGRPITSRARQALHMPQPGHRQ